MWPATMTGYLMTRFLAATGASQPMVGWASPPGLSACTFLLVVGIISLILGTMLDRSGLLILTIPFLLPAGPALRHHPRVVSACPR